MFLRTTTPHSFFHFTPKPSIPKTLIFSRICTISATVSPLSPPSSPPHPWPEWVSFVDRLKSRGYFPNSSSGDDNGGLVYREHKLLKDPCLSFARDRYDVFKSLSKDDIQSVVEIGCPTLVRKVVNSAKRLREYVGLEEKNVCDVCNLRGSCDRAFLKPNDSSLVQTVDIMRLLMFYALDPMVISEAVRPTSNEQAESSARRLLSMLMDLSEASETPISKEIPLKKEKIVNSAATVVSQDIRTRKQGWVCPKCSFLNLKKNSQCRECNEDRPKMQDSAPADVQKGDWNCPQCNYVNFARNISCLKCKEDAPRRHVELKAGDWHCRTCKYLNYARNTQCRNCMEADPEKKESVHIELKKGDWNCPQLHVVVSSKSLQNGMALAQLGVMSCRHSAVSCLWKMLSRPVTFPAAELCGRLNFSRRIVCGQCTATRPPESLNPGEWVCSMCNFLNFRRNVKCLKCETGHVKEAAPEDNHLWIKPVSRQMG
ncbi:hypothetical protein KSS87_002888 [Heliosperma pusillum]|nr:hypothetical protein KSS87_002888 [Heliosperma pusillum]